MSHEIIKNIFVTADRRVIICHAPGNIEPQVFQEEEYGPLTTLLRKEGYERLEEEILYLFFLGVWQNDLRHGRAVARAIEQERMDVYELWKRCGTYRSDGSLSDIWPPISNLRRSNCRTYKTSIRLCKSNYCVGPQVDSIPSSYMAACEARSWDAGR